MGVGKKSKKKTGFKAFLPNISQGMKCSLKMHLNSCPPELRLWLWPRIWVFWSHLEQICFSCSVVPGILVLFLSDGWSVTFLPSRDVLVFSINKGNTHFYEVLKTSSTQPWLCWELFRRVSAESFILLKNYYYYHYYYHFHYHYYYFNIMLLCQTVASLDKSGMSSPTGSRGDLPVSKHIWNFAQI